MGTRLDISLGNGIFFGMNRLIFDWKLNFCLKFYLHKLPVHRTSVLVLMTQQQPTFDLLFEVRLRTENRDKRLFQSNKK